MEKQVHSRLEIFTRHGIAELVGFFWSYIGSLACILRRQAKILEVHCPFMFLVELFNQTGGFLWVVGEIEKIEIS